MSSTARTVYAVSELAEVLRALLEESLPRVWVEGEVSNFSRPSSGHWYFTLKDAKAQLRCAMFRGQNFNVRPQPRDGDRVLVRAELSFYTARGDLQLICEHLEPAGQGALLRAFEELKQRLAAEGLFDPATKRALPRMPRHIGLITSPTGAAVQDVCAALARRFPLVPVSLWPVPVQGPAAAPAIAEALRELPRRAPVDLVLLVRGGGSLEDLWAFNEEIVARAIRACRVPVVSGVGHEIDFSIADFAADLRAPTPTAAAELVTPDQRALNARLRELESTLAGALQRKLALQRQAVERSATRLQHLHPRRSLRERAQRLDELQQELELALEQRLVDARIRLDGLQRRLRALHPARALQPARARLRLLDGRLQHDLRTRLQLQRERWLRLSDLLHSVSPQAVLERGYAIARRNGEVLLDPRQIAVEESFELVLARGPLRATRSG